MKHRLYIYLSLFSTSLVFSAASSNKITECSPLIKPLLYKSDVEQDIQHATHRLTMEGKKLEELEKEITQETFQVLHAYIKTDCPFEALLTLSAQYICQNEDKAYHQWIGQLIAIAYRCDRCR